ncbi:MAG: DNA gyrase inhibitor YacG [Sedimentisphaerales bacterium]
MKHRCPNCKKVITKALLEQSRREKFYPFCSERCKFIDLGRWLDAKYKIVSELKDKEQPNDDEENSGQPKGGKR